jgi:hypothetical protein
VSDGWAELPAESVSVSESCGDCRVRDPRHAGRAAETSRGRPTVPPPPHLLGVLVLQAEQLVGQRTGAVALEEAQRNPASSRRPQRVEELLTPVGAKGLELRGREVFGVARVPRQQVPVHDRDVQRLLRVVHHLRQRLPSGQHAGQLRDGGEVAQRQRLHQPHLGRGIRLPEPLGQRDEHHKTSGCQDAGDHHDDAPVARSHFAHFLVVGSLLEGLIGVYEHLLAILVAHVFRSLEVIWSWRGEGGTVPGLGAAGELAGGGRPRAGRADVHGARQRVVRLPEAT